MADASLGATRALSFVHSTTCSFESVIISVRLIVTLILMILLLLGGCSTISKKDCVRGDWQTIGFRDGKQGYDPNRLQNHAKICAKSDVIPDATAYIRGHKVGVRAYCTPENGSAVGRREGDYTGVCPEDLEYAFLENYVTALRVRLDDLEIERDDVKDDLDKKRDERARIRADEIVPKRLQRSIESLEGQLSSLNYQRKSVNEKIAQWSRKL